MPTMARLVIISIIAISLVALVSPIVAPYGQRCTTCHTGSNPSSGYIFAMPKLQLSYPAVVPPNWTIGITLIVIHPGNYAVIAPGATLAVTGSGGLSSGETAAKPASPIPSSGGTTTVNWTISTGDACGTLALSAKLNFTAHYRHISTHENDESPYMLSQFGTISVRPVELFATQGELCLKGQKEEAVSFELVSYLEARNVSLRPSSNLADAIAIAPSFLRNISPGQRQTVNIYVENASDVVNNGRIDITWENVTGACDTSFVTVRLLGSRGSPPVAASTPLRLTGRITGLLSLGLLMASLALGLVKWGGKRRVRVHCAISWFIVGLSVYHGLMLVIGPYSRLVWGNYVMLGYISAAVMGVSGVNGLAQEQMSRLAGHRTWLWMHRIAIIVAVVLVVIHGIAMGTDFAFLRNIFQGSGP